MDTIIMAPTIRVIMLLKQEPDIEAQEEQAAALSDAEATCVILRFIYAMVLSPFDLMYKSIRYIGLYSTDL